jgi:hypothetical protein
MSTTDPVSWKLIETGWHVVDATGASIGKVDAIGGDVDEDIFDGLAVGKGVLSHSRYVPSESVGEIRMEQVQILLDRAAVEALEEYVEPEPQLEIIPEGSTWIQRLSRWMAGGRDR